MRVTLDLNSVADYEMFLKIKQLPRYEFVGREARFPDEYADRLGLFQDTAEEVEYDPLPGLFDYQEGISRLAIHKRKFAAFVECGYGKTLILLEFADHASFCLDEGQAILIVSPLMVIEQTMAEAKRFYGDRIPIEQVRAADLPRWMEAGSPVGITNYEALTEDVPQGRLGALILDESGYLKSHYGKWGAECIRLGKGLEWKLALTGTPAPNDRIEYANHAVFLDAFPTVNSFLSRFFINRCQTDNRWEIKHHAIGPFYKALSEWSIFMSNPATYGWKDNAVDIPPIHVHIHDVELTSEQNRMASEATGTLLPVSSGGITTRGMLSQLAKGKHNGEQIETLKPQFIRSLVDSWPEESTIIWCLYNDEQERIAAVFPEAGNLSGDTPYEARRKVIMDFQQGRTKVLISKPKILGFGLNLQVATRQVFSGLQDSYESFHQCVKRSNRVGSNRPLNVHIPVTELERPMIETVLRKADRVQADTEAQEKEFYHAAF